MCGVLGIVKRNGEAAPEIYIGLTQIQHRAHDSAGIATFNKETGKYHMYKGLGEVPAVLNEEILSSLRGACGIGHVRWTTEGDIDIDNAHPIKGVFQGKPFYVVHNGEVRDETIKESIGFYSDIKESDTKFIAALVSQSGACNFSEALQKACAILKGTYAMLFLFEDKIYAVRDTTGNRPLIFGSSGGSLIVASETAAFGPLEGEHIREVREGEIVTIDQESFNWSSSLIIQVPQEMPMKLNFCLFEMIYLLRPDSIFLGRTIELVREHMGRKLFEEHPLNADMVVAVYDSGEAAAHGYSFASGIPLRKGLLRSHYAGRMFIEPVSKRAKKLLIKQSVIKEIVKDKTVIVVDDSIVEGGTAKKIISLLRKAGAKVVYFLSSSPPITYPCFYGVPTARKHRRLIAEDHKSDIDTICKEIGADYLGYLSLRSTIHAVVETAPVVTNYPLLLENDFCTACFTGIYPIPICN